MLVTVPGVVAVVVAASGGVRPREPTVSNDSGEWDPAPSALVFATLLKSRVGVRPAASFLFLG